MAYSMWGSIVRIIIELDDDLVAEAVKLTSLGTKKAVVEEALRRLVRAVGQSRAIADMAGLGWDGDLDEIRGRTRSYTPVG